MRLESLRRDLAVRHPGEARAEGVVGQGAPVRVADRLAAVVAKDVGQHDAGRLLRRLGRVAAVVLQELGPGGQVVGDVVDGLPEVVGVLDVVRVDERVDGRMPAPVDLDQRAVALALADRRPQADHRVGAEHVVRHFHHDREDVPVRERVLAGPLEAVEGAVGVGEERVAAHADEQPDLAGHDGRGAGVVERDRGVLDQHVAAAARPGGPRRRWRRRASRSACRPCARRT